MSNATVAVRNITDQAVRLWTRFWSHLNDRAEQEVAAWGSTLQYKRRYTNPDDAKRFRKPLEEM